MKIGENRWKKVQKEDRFSSTLTNIIYLLKYTIIFNSITIGRETREVIRENDTLLQERNYTNITLKNNNNETNLNIRRVFPRGALNGMMKCAEKYNHHS